MDLKLEVKTINLTLGEHKCTLREPTLREGQGYAQKLDSCPDEKRLEEITSFLISLGGTPEVIDNLSARHLNQIMKELLPPGKE